MTLEVLSQTKTKLKTQSCWSRRNKQKKTCHRKLFYVVLNQFWKLFNWNFVFLKVVKNFNQNTGLELCQTSKMECFAKIVRGFELVTIFAKYSVGDVWQVSEYSSALEFSKAKYWVNGELCKFGKWSNATKRWMECSHFESRTHYSVGLFFQLPIYVSKCSWGVRDFSSINLDKKNWFWINKWMKFYIYHLNWNPISN